ncbi:interleukin-1 receptor type 2 isoform X1 [Ochotona curzoniae]|uniref:interleukin-1 receptor type 2 isoform X1 n=1 Tax=Ochotona curzoniae TaxID=130825 RepID=UPI001B353AA9|nr:interleukin-1 receptor type 2 isoform X1 [Ochotona curzoniae]
MKELLKETSKLLWLRRCGPRLSACCVFQELPGTMFILYTLITGVSALTLQAEEHAGPCRFRGKHFKMQFRLEGEPVVLRCPQTWSWDGVSVDPHSNLTWRRNSSAQMVPGEGARMWVKDGTLWLLPALQGDSDTYICTVRNASYCDEMSIELRVFENTEVSLPFVSYPQILTSATSGSLVCPDLREFTRNKTDMLIRWYKDSALLGQDDEKFLSVMGTPYLVIHDVSMEDAGYYMCALTFSHEGRQYNVTRNIELRVKQRREETVPVIISPLQTISAALGSRLTIPCKVFLGAGTPLNTMLWWMANDTEVNSAYQGGRVTEGPRQEYSENNENYIEMPLVFNPVAREDLDTDFKCMVLNTQSLQTLHATVREASSSFSWGIALAPLTLFFLVLGGICLHKRGKRRAGKTYGLTTLRTGHQDFPSYPSTIKEVK